MRYRFQNRGQVYDVSLERNGDRYQAIVNGDVYTFEVLESEPGQLAVRFGETDHPENVGQSVRLYWANAAGEKWVSMNGCTYLLEKPTPRSAKLAGETLGGEAVRAPMPAQVRAIQVAQGDSVQKGDTLMLLEAMKMEIRIKAPAKGKVLRLLVRADQTVDRNEMLAEIGEA